MKIHGPLPQGLVLFPFPRVKSTLEAISAVVEEHHPVRFSFYLGLLKGNSGTIGKFLSNLRSDNQIRERCQLSERIGMVYSHRRSTQTCSGLERTRDHLYRW